jgi:hypothetical protein
VEAIEEPPRVISARFIDPSQVELTFSEPLAPVQKVNPRQFRISHGYQSVDGEGAYATYAEPGYGSGDEDAPPIVGTRLERDPEGRHLTLRLNRGIPMEVCEDIVALRREEEELAADRAANPDDDEGEEVVETTTGLYLHYTRRGSAGIRDQQGEALDDIGAAWALNYGSRYFKTSGVAPVARFDLLIEIECFDVPDPYETENDYASDAYGYGYGYGSVSAPSGSSASRPPPAGVGSGVPGGVAGGVVGPKPKQTPKP